jgi:hypothetical protein
MKLILLSFFLVFFSCSDDIATSYTSVPKDFNLLIQFQANTINAQKVLDQEIVKVEYKLKKFSTDTNFKDIFYSGTVNNKLIKFNQDDFVSGKFAGYFKLFDQQNNQLFTVLKNDSLINKSKDHSLTWNVSVLRKTSFHLNKNVNLVKDTAITFFGVLYKYSALDSLKIDTIKFNGETESLNKFLIKNINNGKSSITYSVHFKDKSIKKVIFPNITFGLVDTVKLAIDTLFKLRN